MPQDFSGQNLQGRSFRGQNLEFANFSGADIRGADFTDAILIRANFSNAKAGLQKHRAIFLVMISWLLSGLSGLGTGIALYFATLILIKLLKIKIACLSAIATVTIFFAITISRGIQTGFKAFAIALAFVGFIAGTITGNLFFGAIVGTSFGLLGALAVACALRGTLAIAKAMGVAGVLPGAVAGALALALAIAGALAEAAFFISAEAITHGLDGALVVADSPSVIIRNITVAFTLTAAVAAVFVLFSTYISWRALKGDVLHALIRNSAMAWAATGGTSFQGSDLSNANFTGATLKSTNFRQANLTDTCFHKTKNRELFSS